MSSAASPVFTMAACSPFPHAFCLLLGFTAHVFFQAAIVSFCISEQGWAHNRHYCHINAGHLHLLQTKSCPLLLLSPLGVTSPTAPWRSAQTFLCPHCSPTPYIYKHLQLLFTHNPQHLHPRVNFPTTHLPPQAHVASPCMPSHSHPAQSFLFSFPSLTICTDSGFTYLCSLKKMSKLPLLGRVLGSKFSNLMEKYHWLRNLLWIIP